MRKLITLVLFLAVAVAGIGYWQGWFSVEKTTTPDGKGGVIVTVDKEKIQHDADAAKARAKELGGKAKDAVQEVGQKVK